MSSIPESMLLTTKKPTFRGMLSNRAGKLLKQLSKSMSGSDLDANEKTYSESTANDDASEEPVGEAKDLALETPLGSGEDQGAAAVEGDKPKEQVVAAQQEEDAAPRGASESAAGQAEAVAAGAEVGSSTEMNGNGVHAAEEGEPSCSWQVYRRARLAKVAKSIYLFATVVGLVSMYVGDVGSMWSEAWTSFTREAVLKESPALARGGLSVLEAGDFMYSCRPSSQEGGACQPTIFFLRPDGSLVLARGKSPSSVKPEDELWTSKKPSSSSAGPFAAAYNEHGILMVRDAQGKTVWRRRPLFTPRLLRPWPLSP